MKFIAILLACFLLSFMYGSSFAQSYDSKQTKIQSPQNYVNKEFDKQFKKYFSKSDGKWFSMNSTSVFKVFVKEGDYKFENGKKIWNRVIFELDPKRNYNDAKDNSAVVIYPILTDSAYAESGFYTYYRNQCDPKCLTVKITTGFLPQANPNALQIFKLLSYKVITDLDVDKKPSILDEYDKVILLHNEYVTKNEFNAIKKHPHVIYLYPNALYAEVKVNYKENTATLIRGHNYPKSEIRNGFDWKFDNSQYEYDLSCKKMQFYKIDNGWMLNCYPENMIHKNLGLLKTIKKL